MTDVGAGRTRNLLVATNSVRDIAKADPARLAVQTPAGSVTYAELDARVDAVAGLLLDRLGRGEHNIVLRFRSALRYVAASIAVQRAGKVCVSIDPGAPPERLRLLMEDVDAAALLSDVATDAAVAGYLVEPVLDPTSRPAEVDEPLSSIANIGFTSGSTGIPKGVMQRHERRSVLVDAVNLSGGVAPRSPFGAVWTGSVGWAELTAHWPFLHGATLVYFDLLTQGLPALPAWLREHRVETIGFLPTLLRHAFAGVPDDLVLPDLRVAILSGETSTWDDARLLYRHLGPDGQVNNFFGQTEALISRFEVPRDARGDGPLPAGTPMAGRTVTIVGADGRPVEPGEVGEIVVDSRDAAAGYWHRPELTAGTFEFLGDGVVRVRTGDGGRLLPDGTLQHLGRIDHVVKIAGNRVELGEVEAALRRIDGVADAAVTTYVDAMGDQRLIGFVVPAGGAASDTAGDGHAVRAELARHLPRPFLPDRIEIVPELTRLPGGKVDRQRLPLPDVTPPAPADGGVDRHADLDQQILAIWREILADPGLGVDDDFFDSGGDSVRAGRMVAELEQRLGLRLPVPIVIETRTASALADAVRSGADLWDPIVPLRTEGSLPPLFVVHDGGGDVFFALNLLDGLGDDQPVYAVQPATADDALLSTQRVEDLAATYVAGVQRTRPDGPLALYGFSFGGMVAYEMAQQLVRAGRDVVVLGIGDTPAPSRIAPERPTRARISRLAELPPHLVVARFWQLISYRTSSFAHRRRVRTAMRTERPAALVGEHYVLKECFRQAGRRYAPATRHGGKTVFIHATGAHAHFHREWPAHVGSDFTVVDIEGAMHIDIARERSDEVAAALRDAIDSALVHS